MTVLCLGDSLTDGYELDRSQAYPARLQKKIDALDWKFKVINAGLGGDTTAAALRRLDWLLQRRIDVLILALGGNDGLRGLPLPEIRKNLEAIISKAIARYPEVKVVVAGMQIPPNYGRQYVQGFRALFPKVAARYRAQLIPFLLGRRGEAAPSSILRTESIPTDGGRRSSPKMSGRSSNRCCAGSIARRPTLPPPGRAGWQAPAAACRRIRCGTDPAKAKSLSFS